LNSSYLSGLGITGSYGAPALRSVININAYGVYSGGGYGADLALSTTSGGGLNEAMRITFEGNVGIGTTNPQHLLSVAGIIGAQEIVVVSGGADYVFDPKYRVAPLSEVAAYIEENHHLPGIPSAKDVAERGVSLGDMQAKMLAKIEELTLHMIDSEERSKRLERENLELQQQAREMQERMARLEAGGGASAVR
jgi:hypothetical protein